MKQTKFILPAVVLSAAGFAMAQGCMAQGSLWNMDVDAYQVQMPDDPITCNKTTDDYTAACYSNNAGWWYAYAGDTENGQTISFEPITKNDDGTYKLIMTDEDGDIIPNGNLEYGGLHVTMSAAGGSSSTPAIAGLGFDWHKDKSAMDISSHPGYCISYRWNGTQPLEMELSWDEEVNGYDTWYALLPTTSGMKTLNVVWSYFKQDGWDENKKPITVAKEKSVGLKIRLKNHSPKEAYGTFTLVDLGWIHKDPMVKTVAKTNSAKATLTNRTLSFSGIRGDANVEIVSLRGQVVLKGTTAAAMDLSRLDAGVYMVRIAGSVNLAQKILLK